MSDSNGPSDNDVFAHLAAIDRAGAVDPRVHAAWRTWLAALARDADAATASALAYQALPPSGRDAWLDALEADAPYVDVPTIALYAPLLGVEQDEARRARIVGHVVGAATCNSPRRALVGSSREGRVCAIISPLYLEFVELLLCRYDPDEGVIDVRHDWLVHESEVNSRVAALGATLREVALGHVVEELAHAVVADRRAGRAAPAALARYSDLFGLDADAVERAVANVGGGEEDDE